MFEAILLVLGGFVLLGGGGEGLVSGAVSLADRLKVPPLIIGLTVIALIQQLWTTQRCRCEMRK